MPRTRKNEKSKEDIEQLRRQLNIPGSAGTIRTASSGAQQAPDPPIVTHSTRKRNVAAAAEPALEDVTASATRRTSRKNQQKVPSTAQKVPSTATTSSQPGPGAPALESFTFNASNCSPVGEAPEPSTRPKRGRPKKEPAVGRRATRSSASVPSDVEPVPVFSPPHPPPPPAAPATVKYRQLNPAEQNTLSTIKSSDSEAAADESGDEAAPALPSPAAAPKSATRKKKSFQPENAIIPGRDFVSSSPIKSPSSSKKDSSISKKGSILESSSSAGTGIIPALGPARTASLASPPTSSSPNPPAASSPNSAGLSLDDVVSSIVPGLGSSSVSSASSAVFKRATPTAVPKSAPLAVPSPALSTASSTASSTGSDIIPALHFQRARSPLKFARGGATRLPQSPLALTRPSSVPKFASSAAAAESMKPSTAARTLDDLVDSMPRSPVHLRGRANRASFSSSSDSPQSQAEQPTSTDEEMDGAAQSNSTFASSSKARGGRSIVLLDAPPAAAAPRTPKSSAHNSTFTIPKTKTPGAVAVNPLLKQSYLLPSAGTSTPNTLASGRAFPHPPRPPKIARVVPVPMDVDEDSSDDADADGGGVRPGAKAGNLDEADVELPDADACDLELDRAEEEPPSLPPSLTMEVDAQFERVFCVLDTNVFIDWLPFLDALFTQAIAEQTLGVPQTADLSRLHLGGGEHIRCYFVLPWKLTSELDYQHSFGLVPHAGQFPGSSSRGGGGGSNGNGGGRSGTLYSYSSGPDCDSRTLSQMELKERARLALACIREHLRNAAHSVSARPSQSAQQLRADSDAPHNAPIPVIVSQTIREDREACETYRGINNDDHILLCTLALTDRCTFVRSTYSILFSANQSNYIRRNRRAYQSLRVHNFIAIIIYLYFYFTLTCIY